MEDCKQSYKMFTIWYLTALSTSIVLSSNPLTGTKDAKSSPERPMDTKFGDIKLTDGQRAAISRGENITGSKAAGYAATNKVARWTNGVIPYEIDCSLENMPTAVAAITDAIAEWEQKTCLRFPRRRNEKNYLKFFRDTHCWGNVGMIGGPARISVGDGCDYKHVMVHEIGHVVGFFHEQNRKDRDQYVTIQWQNIAQFKDAFDIVQDTDSLGVEYDYESIMHYPWTAFSSNGKETMVPTRPLNGKVPYIQLSSLDVRQTHLMYNNCRTRKRREVLANSYMEDEIKVEKRSACQDNSPSCPSWAQGDGCKDSQYMLENCKLSCKLCSIATGGSCADKSTSCRSYAKSGYCNTDQWTQANCHFSCGKCGTTSGTNSGSCQDKDANCKNWVPASCTTSDYVKDNCQKSCGTCPTTTGGGNCQDKDANCKNWVPASCTTSDYVKDNCQKSCGTCPTTTGGGNCQDKDANCKNWVPASCTTSDYVKDNCQKSCGTCPTTTGGGEKCEDKEARTKCLNWYQQGHCKEDEYTRLNCRKTCEICGGHLLVTKQPTRLGIGILCKDYDDLCKAWTASGECTRNPDFMRRTCHISCNHFSNCDRSPQRPSGTCNIPVGIGIDLNGKFTIPDSSLTASSSITSSSWDYSARNARLYIQDDQGAKRVGGWCPDESDRDTSYLQVDLGQRMSIKHIATQGRNKYFERVEKFEVSYSDNGSNFKMYKEGGKDVIFNANCDHFTPMVNTFEETIVARYIRIHPLMANYPCLRIELFRC